MYILGLAGGPATLDQQELNMSASGLSHDGSAVLIKDGVVVAAVEEERLNRIKHSNLFPEMATRFCLETAGISIADLDAIAFYLNEPYLDHLLATLHTQGGIGRRLRARDVFGERLRAMFGREVRERIQFVDHHLAHAHSALHYAGGNDALVVVMDSAGEFSSGLIGRARDGKLEKLCDLSIAHSLGFFYVSTIKFMGLQIFDEYKAMGLAPYGDPAVFRAVFNELYLLKEDGQFELASKEKLAAVLSRHVPTAPSSDDLQQCHRDLAAGLQEALETIVFHMLRHWRQVTGLAHLVMAGGVAHNCTMNGRILSSGLFKSVFVQPAAHDAGCALGAANYAAHCLDPRIRIAPFHDVYWGKPLPAGQAIQARLEQWSDWLEFSRPDDLVAATADCLAAGDVFGWVQGRSEFGPRALGNRSIIADPRPAANRARINFMIKKREGFRPFAPSVTEEAAATYFEIGAEQTLPFMSFVVKVRPEHCERLGAITHVDGTARVQTVARYANPRYWALLDAMESRIGVPMLLNTSFNNNIEPIVDGVDDAIACYLTTGLDKLVIGDFLIVARELPFEDKLRGAFVRLMSYATLEQAEGGASRVSAALIKKAVLVIRPDTAALLARAGQHPERTFGDLMGQAGCAAAAVAAEILALWEKRLVRIEPAAS